MLQSAHNISALTQLAKKIVSQKGERTGIGDGKWWIDLCTRVLCVVCWLVVCSCCPSITIIIIIVVTVKRHGHEMRQQRHTHTQRHLLNIGTYVIYTILLCPSGCLLLSVLYMLKLGPETSLYKHFTAWKPHKKWTETVAHWSEFIYILLKRIAF